MNSLSHTDRYTAVKAGSAYLLPETVQREWDPNTLTYSSYDELRAILTPVSVATTRKEVLRFLAVQHLLGQVFDTLITEFGSELAELGGIVVVYQGQVVYSAHHTNPEWPRILVLQLGSIANAAKEMHTLQSHEDRTALYVGITVLFLGLGLLGLKRIWK
jgi:hypothetical protein